MDNDNMFNHVTNCNVGYDNRDDKLSQKETAELLTFATTLANAVIIGIATKDMIENSAALLYSITRKISPNKSSVSRADESAYLITDQDIHKCQACGETGTLSPKLWKLRRSCPDDFKNPNFCKFCFDWARGVPRWERGTYLAAHPRPRVGASSQSVLHVAGATTVTGSSLIRASIDYLQPVSRFSFRFTYYLMPLVAC